MGLFSGIIDTVGGLIGDIGGGDLLDAGLGFLGASNQKSTNATNVALSRDQMDFQERMSSTAHQREVADLKAAGLNPMLSGMGGSGASTPVGSLARVENSAAAGTKSFLDAQSARLIKAQTATAATQAELNSAQTAKVVQEAREASANADVAQFHSGRYAQLGQSMIGVESKELDARQAKAVTARFRESNDYNAIQELIEEAHKHGFSTIDGALVSTEFRQKVNDLYQSRLKNAEVEAFSNMYHSNYGKNVAPYVNSAVGVAGAAANAARTVKTLKGR